MDPELEVMEGEVKATRESLQNKIEQLEAQVTETVEGVTAAAKDTVSSTADAVQETVNAVRESVSDAVDSVGNVFSIQHQIEERPWLVLGGSVLAGFLVTRMMLGPSTKMRLHPEERLRLVDAMATDPRFCATAATDAVDKVEGRKSEKRSLLSTGLREAGVAIARALLRAAITPL